MQVRNTKPSKIPISFDVPQDSILGSFLVLLDINNFPHQCGTSKLGIYADDTSLLITRYVCERQLDDDTDSLTTWFQKNSSVSITKCKFIHFGENFGCEFRRLGEKQNENPSASIWASILMKV